MAKLDAKERKALPKKNFAEPGKRAYPVNDKPHARAAKSRASEMEHKGKIFKGTEAQIDRKTDKVLGEKGGKKESHHVISPKREHASMHVRRVANGYIVRHSGRDGMESEHYTDEAPKVRVRK